MFLSHLFKWILIANILIHSSQSQSIGKKTSNVVVYTCCILQDSLDKDGYCEQPISEFNFYTFTSTWNVPKPLRDGEREIEFTLQNRPKGCFCGRNFEVNTKLGYDDSEDKLTPVKGLSNEQIQIRQDGELVLENETHFTPHQYCINKLINNSEHPISLENPSILRVMEIKFRICTHSCFMNNRQTPPLSIGRSFVPYRKCLEENDEMNNPNLKILDNNSNKTDSKEKCKLTTFYLKDEDLSLRLVDSNGKITSIEDKTYPWDSLDEKYFCITTPELNYIKYCLAEVKTIFYDYQKIYAGLAGVSGLFLLLNLSIYFALRDSLSISGWTEFAYSLSLYAYFVFSIPGLLIIPENQEVKIPCYVLSVLIQFFELANGTTLVALSFDILLTFSKYEKQDYTDDPQVTKFRLAIYFLLSFFIPSGIVSYGIVKNKGYLLDELIGTPQYGLFQCTAPGDWVFSTYVQFGMQGLNLLMALISAYVILNKRKYRNEFGVVEESPSELDPDRMDIFSKLFVFVFTFWILDFLELFLSKEHFTLKWYGIAFHLINYSQGIFAFFILVCNRQTLREMRQNNWNLKSLFQHACCTCSRLKGNDDMIEEEVTLSPLMKSGTIQSYRRSTLRGNNSYY